MKGICLPEDVCRILLDASNASKNEYEKTFTFAFSLHIGVLTVSTLGQYPVEKDVLLSFYETVGDVTNNPVIGDHPVTGDELSRNRIRERVKGLVRITHALLTAESTSELPGAPGLREWMELLQDHFDRQMAYTANKKKAFDDFQEKMTGMINGYLGIEGAIKTEIYFYIRQIVSALFFNDPGTQLEDLFAEIRKKKQALHKFLVAKTGYIAKTIGGGPIPEGKEEVRLFAVARNESLRLEYFIRYYTDLGVDRIFLIDNNSTDATREIALRQPNVHVFKIDEGYKNHWNWVEFFLERYGRDRWCVVVDIDELLHIPSIGDPFSIRPLIAYMEKHEYTALRSFLLDMYSDKPLNEAVYEKGANPLSFCPYFDPLFRKGTFRFFDRKKQCYFIGAIYCGGMRKRVFIQREDRIKDFCLTKIPLFKFTGEAYLTMGMHSINGAMIADIEGTVLHTKFLFDFGSRVTEEASREEHYDNASEYKIYNKRLEAEPKLTLKYARSVQFTGAEQLLRLGMMKSSKQYEDFINYGRYRS